MTIKKIGLCTWSLGNELDQVTSVMKESGLTRLHLEVPAIDLFQEAIAQHGWTVSCTMIGFPQEDYSTLESIRRTGGIIPDEYWDQNKALVLDAIARTAATNVPFLTTHAGFIDHRDTDAYTTFRSRILELADAAGEANLMLLMETGQETAADLRHCLMDLRHPALGVNFDPANIILYGKGDPVEAVGILAPWIKHVHVKDAKSSRIPGEWGREVPWGDGEVPHQEFLQALRETGYDGNFAVEREAGESREGDIHLAVSRLT